MVVVVAVVTMHLSEVHDDIMLIILTVPVALL